ncbi:hypothetical protein, partial [Tepidimonas aquatica]|uniref:hypothetical protein n=1 Tax=Tepidimonas aquatica TaxID=247482 RepID=UPI00118657CD
LGGRGGRRAEQVQLRLRRRGALLQLRQHLAPEPHPALLALAELDPDALSPRQALEALYRLRALVQNQAGNEAATRVG